MIMDDSKKAGTVVFLELFYLSFLVISICNVISEAACLESERQALLRFKQDLIDSADRLASWSSSGGNCCDWNGLVCDNVTGRVVQLHLGNRHHPDYDKAAPGKPFERSRLSGDNMLESVVTEVHFSNVTRLRLLQASGNPGLNLKVSPGWLGSTFPTQDYSFVIMEFRAEISPLATFPEGFSVSG
ncbi:hypothetical protein F3Y22_tig00110954pilonHSYRG00078 [Hibiscus syriacus]|uniref:Leucine-rich repeat-containing N-terminal plant-type domain-containing protein n=1 Tax=Hibiscus syriacus TaxID=106335 RepID=A0A6A2ZB80_HIBSY|nr:hypothetical protein F3Y22_tig00110954pilonHSYRG00078 [Hibiscus syriacus]